MKKQKGFDGRTQTLIIILLAAVTVFIIINIINGAFENILTESIKKSLN